MSSAVPIIVVLGLWCGVLNLTGTMASCTTPGKFLV